jgi:hypothetical protein
MKLILKNSDIVFQKKHEVVIQYKKYWNRASTQYVDLTSVGSSLINLRSNQLKIILDAYYTAASVLTNGEERIFGARNYVDVISLAKDTDTTASLKLSVSSTSNVSYNAFTESGDFSVEWNVKTGVATMDSVTKNLEGNTSTLNYAGIYCEGFSNGKASPTTASGRSKFRRLRLYNADTDAIICDIRPALVDDTPCLYDSVHGVVYTSGDGTAMVLEGDV